MVELESTSIQRNLDAKFKIGGLEASDLLLVLCSGAVTSFLTSSSSFSIIFTIGVPAIVFALLMLVKKGRPEGYLAHLTRYYFYPRESLAAKESKNTLKIARKIYELTD